MKHQITHYFFIVLSITTFLFLTSCGSKRDILYFQDYNDKNTLESVEYSTQIMPNDNLFIMVTTASNPEAVEVFNLSQFSGRAISTSSLDLYGYLVDSNGNINLPLVGEVKVAGLKKSEAINLLQDKISFYLEEKPIVNIRIMNFKVSVMGEVSRPGVYTVSDERISIPLAISMAGDLTILGERKTVQLKRMENGELNTYIIDLTSNDLFFSPYYYLRQGDLLYVSPNKARVGASVSNPSIPLVISIVSATLTLATFFLRFK